MPSDVRVASLIIGGSIGGSIVYATRSRSIQYETTAHLGRNEDAMRKQLDEITKTLKAKRPQEKAECWP